ncbi:hypothetical protein [Methylorubrum suomiense]|uniref:Uncharacterized protein n=1 Tax=Methylorubrum suomiense TaxID=144191 RepID=A0ABQ4V1V3_9HYPH|nr:hypothetical protein [Methylorubrum suomiense]GJE78556.1 hypothetical protein BGCPKDLD_5173 [Methylorubrum suomiense]
MPGNQLVPDDPNYRRAFQKREPSLSERVGDGLEGYFTGASKGRFWPELIASAARAFVWCWLILAFLLAFHPVVGFIGPFRPMTPTWLRTTNGSDAEFLRAVLGWIGAVLSHWQWFLILYIPWVSLRAYAILKEAVPRHFRERSERRAAAEKERQQIRRDYEAGLARQLRAADDHREAAERARQAELAAQEKAKQQVIANAREYLRQRAEARARVEHAVQVDIARARVDALRTGDDDPEAPYLRVRESMKRTEPKPPHWGLLRDPEVIDNAIRRVIGDGKWLPEAPPYPPEIRTGLLN